LQFSKVLYVCHLFHERLNTKSKDYVNKFNGFIEEPWTKHTQKKVPLGTDNFYGFGKKYSVKKAPISSYFILVKVTRLNNTPLPPKRIINIVLHYELAKLIRTGMTSLYDREDRVVLNISCCH